MMPERYSVLKKHILQAYSAYGGFVEFFQSPFLHIAALYGLITITLNRSADWQSQIFSIAPSLLGFTLAAYTIFISSLSGSITRALISAKDGDVSYYRKINVTFFHFIFVQAVAIAYTLVFPSLTSFSLPLILSATLGIPSSFAICINWLGYWTLNFLGLSILAYCVLQVVAVIIWVYRIISIVEKSPPAD